MTLAATPEAPRRTHRLGTITALVLTVGTLASCGGGSASGSVTVEAAWARTSPMDSANGAAYFTITSPADDALVAVSVDADVAARAELHETVMSDGGMGGDTTMDGGMGGGMGGGTTMPMGQMTMREVDAIELPAGAAVALQPGGFHVMLLDLAGPLEIGDTITLTLALESGVTVDVDVPVHDEAP
ncbi:MAG: copper chaperone PCu(A)C [Ilumatobacteraceae bacterium]